MRAVPTDGMPRCLMKVFLFFGFPLWDRKKKTRKIENDTQIHSKGSLLNVRGLLDGLVLNVKMEKRIQNEIQKVDLF